MRAQRTILTLALLGALIAASLFGRSEADVPPAPAHRPPPAARETIRPGGDAPARAKDDDSPRSAGLREAILSARWGTELGAFGRREAAESNPEAPMAIAAAGDELLVLDQVNGRVQRFRDGRAISAFTVPDTAQDVALTKDGRVLVLDRLGGGALAIHGANGELIQEIGLRGRGVEDPGELTGVFADNDGIYVEREHGTLLRIADSSGAEDAERPELPGRPSRDGSLIVTAAIVDPAAGRVVVTAFDRRTLEPRWSLALALEAMVLRLLLLDSDPDGHVYLAAETAHEGPAPDFRLSQVEVRALRMDATGRITGRLTLPPLASGDEMLRPLAIDEEGRLYALQSESSGGRVERWVF